jgi:hypothetical protein
MSTYLNKLIEGVKRELEQERARVEHVVFRQKAIEMRETGALKRLEQRLEALEQLKVKEAVTNRRRAASSARVSRRPQTAGHRPLRQQA